MFPLSWILLLTFQMSFFFFSVLSAFFVFIFPGLLLFLSVVSLCFSPLVLTRIRCPRMLFASFCWTSSLVLPAHSLLPLPLIGLFLLPLLTCLLLFGRAVFVGLQLLGPFLVTLRFLLSWLRPLCLLPRFFFMSFYLRGV